MTVALVVVGVVLTLAVAGVVSTILVMNHQATVAAEQRAHRAAVAKAKEKREQAEELAREQAAAKARQQTYDSCIGQVDTLQTALTDLNSRLSVGMMQADYSDLVSDASVAYGHIDTAALSAASDDCVKAATSLEAALNAYITANTTWNDCLIDYVCAADNDALLKRLREQWTKASADLDDARATLDQLNPDTTSGTAS